MIRPSKVNATGTPFSHVRMPPIGHSAYRPVKTSELGHVLISHTVHQVSGATLTVPAANKKQSHNHPKAMQAPSSKKSTQVRVEDAAASPGWHSAQYKCKTPFAFEACRAVERAHLSLSKGNLGRGQKGPFCWKYRQARV